MRESRHYLIILLAVGLAGACLYVIREDTRAPVPEVVSPSNPEEAPATQPIKKVLPGAGRPRRPPAPAADPSKSGIEGIQRGNDAAWQDTLENVLISSEADESKTQSLLDLIPRAPESAQEEIAHHLVNLLDDDHYASAGVLLTNLQTSTNVLEVLMNDLLNRPDAVKLPTLVQIQRVEQHPKAAEARELLQHYLDHDFGSNSEGWDQAVKNWLKEHGE